jgi:glycosyltransferase involved in cell wall biosynthesis
VPGGLAVVETHPVQYHAPVYRCVQGQFGVPVTAIYGSDFSVIGYEDPEFKARFAWDTDLLSGHEVRFLRRVAEGGAQTAGAVSARGLGRTLAETAPAAVLVCGYGSPFHRMALAQAMRRRLPILFRAETTDHAVQRSRLKAWARSRTLRALYRRCSRLLYIGERSYQHFRKLGCPERRLVFSPYCVDPTTFRAREADRAECRTITRAELGIGPSRTVVLFAGKLSPRKGPDLLLRAARMLPASGDERPVLLFLGDGELRGPLERLANEPPVADVRFVGFQNQTRLSAFYHAADLLTLPSRHLETWGLVVNEALLHGVPCVVSDVVGCAPDLVRPGVTGEIFRADSVEELGLALARGFELVGRPDVRAACRAALSEYSVERAAAGIAAAFRAVVSAPRGAVV